MTLALRRSSRFYCFAILFTLAAAAPPTSLAAAQPNILWLTCEDMSADLGCYGDKYSHSPTLSHRTVVRT